MTAINLVCHHCNLSCFAKCTLHLELMCNRIGVVSTKAAIFNFHTCTKQLVNLYNVCAIGSRQVTMVLATTEQPYVSL